MEQQATRFSRGLPRPEVRGLRHSRGQLGRVVENCLRPGIPIELLAGPIGLGRHDAGHGMRISVVYRGVRLFAASQAIQPVGHVRGVLVPYRRWRK